jgi:CPA2 family monovalent cation:H+ antiporter-2
MATQSDFILQSDPGPRLLCPGGVPGLTGFTSPPSWGTLTTGLVIGPYGFGLLRDVDQIEALAQVGTAFLLFTLGVEFSLTELRRVQKIALPG